MTSVGPKMATSGHYSSKIGHKPLNTDRFFWLMSPNGDLGLPENGHQ